MPQTAFPFLCVAAVVRRLASGVTTAATFEPREVPFSAFSVFNCILLGP